MKIDLPGIWSFIATVAGLSTLLGTAEYQAALSGSFGPTVAKGATVLGGVIGVAGYVLALKSKINPLTPVAAPAEPAPAAVEVKPE